MPYQSKNERKQGCWIKMESNIPCHVSMCCSPFSPTYLKYSCVMLTSMVWMHHRAEAWLNWITVPTLLHGMLPWHVWDPSSSPCQLIWSRSWPSQSKRSQGPAAEQVNHILRRPDSQAGTTLETLLLSYLFPVTLSNFISPLVPTQTDHYLIFNF